MAAEGANHADDLGLHVALGEALRLACPAHCLIAAAGLEAAQQTAAILDGEHFFLGEIAMEVEAVEMELLRNHDFFFGELGRGEEAVERPVAPGDGRVDADAAAVEAKECVGSNSLRREPAEAEVDGAGVARRGAFPLRFHAVELGRIEIPKARGGTREIRLECGGLTGFERGGDFSVGKLAACGGIERRRNASGHRRRRRRCFRFRAWAVTWRGWGVLRTQASRMRAGPCAVSVSARSRPPNPWLF